MKYYSTNKESPIVDFKEATIKGQAPDKGLYFPEVIPQVDKELINKIESTSNEEIAFRVIKPYVGNTIDDESLFQIVSETVNFPIPLVEVNDKISSLELFHGPTLAFKDVGARFMSRCLGHFLSQNTESSIKRNVTVLVATSGDTGGAVANGFYDVEGVDVIILYPSGKVSPVQEKQLTTLGKNIKALEVQGTFDDCQQMVKQAFTDKDIKEKLFLTSANSINVARWLPQQFYYFFAYKQWKEKNNPPVISVPSGNFGNICAGILAMQSGLPIKHFIAACNANDIVSEYLDSEKLIPRQSVTTLSNAMDVGNPSNFVRILEIFHHQFPELKSKLSSYSISDKETMKTIAEVYQKENYILDPHGAVGYLSLQRYLNDNPNEKGIFLETAHPVKFPEAVEKATGHFISIPDSLLPIMKKDKLSIVIPADYSALKDFLLNKS
ncbi:MAG: threonine synthase [Chitinophagaceae bacterium]|nr:threonine synthase [Chitinophagaceae bacterium]MBK8605630.1 threonine synthase [Chitinophagaceae bacterium]MBP6479026.1 threonine synthase [Chitinophagaceae bacterium]MBP7109389.1 threonine synthase [Chitinophagaceae bacterium]MBP7314242.1 threonine synthase [Chitinophagaceae bacterium]